MAETAPVALQWFDRPGSFTWDCGHRLEGLRYATLLFSAYVDNSLTDAGTTGLRRLRLQLCTLCVMHLREGLATEPTWSDFPPESR